MRGLIHALVTEVLDLFEQIGARVRQFVAASAAASAHVAYTEYWVRRYSGLED